MSKEEETEKGWVIASMNGAFIFSNTFQRTRSNSIEKWMSYWDEDICSWRKFKKAGYKCVKATQTIKLNPSKGDNK